MFRRTRGAVVLASLQACVALASPAGRIDARWELLSGPVDPPQTANARAIHDARRHRMVLVNGDNFGELWQSSLPATGRMDWKRVPVGGTQRPRGRFGFSAVYDSLRDRVILFAGNTYAGGLNDTWELSLGDAPEWRPVDVPGELPAPRGMHVAVWDPVRDRMLIFGGAVMPDYSEQQYFADTWALELHGEPVWTRFAATGPVPTPRKGATAVYDPWNDRMVMFGGWNGTLPWPQSLILDDTWILSLADGGQWSGLAVSARPAARQEHVAIVDPVRRQMIVTGGNLWQWHFTNDTWALPLDTPAPEWAQLSTAGDNPRVGSHTALFSPERGSVIQFGGQGSGNEHFELDLESLRWSAVDANAPDTFPSRRLTTTLLPDASGDHLVMLGGTWWACPSDLWRFDLQEPRAWRRLPVSGVGPSCLDHDLVHDPVRRRVLAFGCRWLGRFQPCVLDVWQLPLEGTREWSRVDVRGEMPPGRQWFSLSYDPRRDRVLMFGGARLSRQTADMADDLDDLWSFSLPESRWERITPTNSPGPRNRHAAVHDAARDRMLVLAGARSTYRGYIAIHDAWALSLEDLSWSRLPDVPAVFGEYEGSEANAVLDPLRDRVLVSDGYTKAWALPLAHPEGWTALAIAGEPPTPRLWYGLAFDAGGDRLLLHGGYDGSAKGDLWALSFSRRVDVVLLRHGMVNPAGNPRRRIEVAILAEDGFSPDSVEAGSVTLAGAPALGPDPRSEGAGTRPGREGPPITPHARRDVNGDGRPDLVLAFASDALRLESSETVAVLRGRTPSFEVRGRASLASSRIEARASSTAPGESGGLDVTTASGPGRLLVHYRLPQAGSARVEVFDLLGRRVSSREIDATLPREGELHIDGATLRPGMYHVRLRQQAQIATARAILLR